MTAHTTRPAGQTLFLATRDVADVVNHLGLATCLARVADRIEADFRRWPSFDKSPRSACHTEHGVVELMPVADSTCFAFKYVNGHPANTSLGLPTVMAFGVLADMHTGAPRLLAELTLATAIRTAAMSALAARHLARPNPRVMALIGNGAQAEFQALAFQALLGVQAVRLYDTDPAATRKLMHNLAASGLHLTRCASVHEAVQGADIVTTVTDDKTRAAVLTAEMLSPGQHINAVGGDCPGKTELHPEVLQQARVFCEYEPQTRIEGDIQQLAPDFPVTELWRVLTGSHAGRQSDHELTVFDSVGFALEDFSMLQVLDDAARRLGVGVPIDLVAQPPNPKDLYSLLRRPAAPVATATPSATAAHSAPQVSPEVDLAAAL
ncbi:MAG: ornithine cyclodeaminase [Rubrivivax sp.]